MSKTNSLVAISETITDPYALFIDKTNTNSCSSLSEIDKQKRTLIALYRIESTFNPYLSQQFLGFAQFFSKIILSNYSVSFYDSFIRFLQNQYNESPFQVLYKYLSSQGYSLKRIYSLLLTNDEIQFSQSLPQHTRWLAILIFYLYDPVLVQDFFSKFFPK